MSALKIILKWIAGIFIVYLVGGTLIENHFKKEKEERCASLEKESVDVLPHLITSNLALNGSSVTGRITNNSNSDVNGEAVFNVVVRDCIGSNCSVVGRENYFAQNISIPPGEARDFVATPPTNDMSKISPQGRLQISIELTDVNWGRFGCFF